MLKDKPRIFTTIALAFFLVGLPLGSFYYLRTGLDFYKDNMSMLDKKGEVPTFKAMTQNGDVITNDSMIGRVFISQFFTADCGEPCDKTTDNLLLIQKQFKNKVEIMMLTHSVSPQDSVAVLKAYAERVGANSAKWLFLTGDQSVFEAYSGSDKGAYKDLDFSQKLVLMDGTGSIRNYYDAHDDESFNDLVRHIALIMPREAKPEVKFRPEKEK